MESDLSRQDKVFQFKLNLTTPEDTIEPGESMVSRLAEESKKGWELEGCNDVVTTTIDTNSDNKLLIAIKMRTCIMSKLKSEHSSKQ